MTNKIQDFLFKEINPLPLAIFRIFFGFILCYQAYYYISINYAYQFITGPELLFKYPLLQFINPISETIINGSLYLMLLASIFIALGIKTRWFSFLSFIILSYLTFIDQTLYNNHLYLFIILLGLLSITNSDNSLSVSNLKNKKLIQNWHLFLFQITIFCVYFFGGIAKLNYDWISGILPQILISSKIENPNILFLYFITYGGLIFDLLIGFLLWNKRTFIFALIPILIFNITNGIYLFDDIGIFPLFMILASVLFLPSTFYSPTNNEEKEIIKNKNNHSRSLIAFIFVIIFTLFQFIFPLRHYFLTSNPEWTGIGAKFSWRMKMQHKKITTFDLKIVDEINNIAYPIDYTSFLSYNQQRQFINDPNCIIQLAKHVSLEGKKRGIAKPVVRGDIKISFNGRQPQSIFDPNLDLSKIPINRWKVAEMVLPLEE